MTACPECLRRTWLLGALAGRLDPVRGRIDELLALDDRALIDAVGGGSGHDALVADWDGFDAIDAERACDRAELTAICRCEPDYPTGLRDLPVPPAVIHVAGDPAAVGPRGLADAVAVVGARQCSVYGGEVARILGAELATAGLTVVSGMAIGIDAAAHRGALTAEGGTVAVLAGGADVPYPARNRRVYERTVASAAAISELGPGVTPRRWMFPARNRIIAALSAMTVVVQARERSGALVTARWARTLGRELGAVPGAVTSPLSTGPHRLIAEGARIVAGAQDVLDGLFGAGQVAVARRARERLGPELARLLDALAEGESEERAFARAGLDADGGLAALASLELSGIVRRGTGGRFSVRW